MEGVGPKYNWLYLLIGAVTGISGETLDHLDQILGIILKVTSIISFIIYLILNWKKIWEKLQGKKTKQT